MRRAATALGVVGLVLVSLAPPARGERNGSIVAGVGMAALTTIVCWTTAIATRDENVPEEGYARRGFLLGIAGAYAFDNFESEEQTTRRTRVGNDLDLSLTNVDESLGFKGSLGYRCHPRLSGEESVEWLKGFDGDVSLAGSGVIGDVKIEPFVVTSNLKGHILTGRFQPFLLAGGGVMTARTKARDTGDPRRFESDRDTEIVLRFGGGIDIYATEHVVVSVGADYVLPFGDLENLDYISIGWGVQYRF